MKDEIPRRACMSLLTPAEHAIFAALQEVESMPADVRLTDAVVLLGAARHSVADYVDGIDKRRYVHEGQWEQAGMLKAFWIAFAEWDKRYRENPRQFMTDVAHLLGHTPTSYGEACAAYFVALLNELSTGKAWEQIGA